VFAATNLCKHENQYYAGWFAIIFIDER
jgi:hypothetical protein